MDFYNYLRFTFVMKVMILTSLGVQIPIPITTLLH